MAYNTRRGGGYMPTSAASVGQRRPNQQQQQLGNNFVSGGQLTQPNKPLVQMPPQQQQAMQRQQQGQQQKTQQLQAMANLQKQQNLRQQAQQFLAQQQPQLQQPQQQQPQLQQQQPQLQQQQPQLQQQQPQQLPQQQIPPQQGPVQQQQQAQQPKIVFKVEEKPTLPVQGTQSVMENTNGSETAGGDVEDGPDRRSKKNKPFWMRKDGKINKKERLRRRNQRLRKILQPKNALMVLNELIGSAPYNMTESADMYEGTVFRCTVLVDGLEHVGIGKSKPAAKTAAAEAALKHMVLSKLKNTPTFEPPSVAVPPADGASAVDGDGDIKMEMESEDNLGGISWSHVACYALHKLLSSWDEGSNLAEKLAHSIAAAALTGGSGTTADKMQTFEKKSTNESFKTFLQLAQAAAGGCVTTPDKTKTFEKRPAKKLPDTAATMNPIMLLNQMHPNASYEEVSKAGNPPNVQFTVKCTVNGEAFLGTGSTKKGARKMCAFAACRKVLGIQYAPAFLEEHGFSEDAVTFCPASALPMQVA